MKTQKKVFRFSAIGAALLIVLVAFGAMPALTARAVNTTLSCPLPMYDATHYALQQGETVTCTINDAIFIGSPSTLAIHIVHPTLGTEVVWGTVSGTTITFTYTGRGDGCETELIWYSDNDGHLKALAELSGFGYVDGSGNPIACGGLPTSTPTPTNTPTPTPQAFFGCTPGFWKNHLGGWPAPYTPGTHVIDVFSDAAGYPNSIKNATLLQALGFKGGPDVNGGARNLLRAGVAALLNAQAGIGYPLTTLEVIDQVNAALATHNRDQMIALAGDLDDFNNLPHSNCPSGTSAQVAPSVRAARTGNTGFVSFVRNLWSSFVARLDPASASVMLR